MTRFILGVIMASCLWSIQLEKKLPIMGHSILGSDFGIYYHAALTDYSWIERQPLYRDFPLEVRPQIGWLYHESLAILWLPWTLLPFYPAMVLWMLLMHGSYFFLIHRVMEKPYGWTIVLATWKPLSVALLAGNVSPFLALLLTTALGSYLAPAIKPHLALISTFLPVRDAYRGWISSGVRLRRDDLSSSTLVRSGIAEELAIAFGFRGGARSWYLDHSPEMV